MTFTALQRLPQNVFWQYVGTYVVRTEFRKNRLMSHSTPGFLLEKDKNASLASVFEMLHTLKTNHTLGTYTKSKNKT